MIVRSVLLACALATQAKGDGFSDLADQCMTAIEAGDTSAFEVAAEAIKKRSDVFNTEARKKAEACLSQGYGEIWVYDFPASRFMTSQKVLEGLAAANAAKLAKAMEEVERELAAADLAHRKAENAERVATLVYGACTTLLARDEVEAMTNQLCVDSFLTNGLPAY